MTGAKCRPRRAAHARNRRPLTVDTRKLEDRLALPPEPRDGAGRRHTGRTRPGHRRARGNTPRDAGSALVESLVAVVLIAIAGALVASAARTGLRAAARAATLTRTSALAGREIARLAATAATATSTDTTLTVTGFTAPVTCAADVARDGNVVALAVDVVAGRPPERVALATRRWLAPPAGQ